MDGVLRTATLGLAALTAGFLVSFWAPHLQEAVAVARAPNAYQPELRSQEGPELQMIFIGSSGCAASNLDFLPAAVDGAKVRLESAASANGYAFSAVGVARDWSVSDGIAHLRRFGAWDEVMSGRNWLNRGLLHYVWDEFPGEAATPQVVIVERRVFARDDPAAAAGVVQNERVILRKVGADEIQRWYARGAPIPGLRPVGASSSS